MVKTTMNQSITLGLFSFCSFKPQDDNSVGFAKLRTHFNLPVFFLFSTMGY